MISAIVCYTAAALIMAGLVVFGVSLVLRYWRLHGPRLVTCPTDNSRAAVEVDAFRGTFAFDWPQLHFESCSHWPERGSCGQECLRQIEQSPDGCLVRRILAGWYAGKTCVLCGMALGQIDWMEHKPCLMQPDRITLEWSQVHALEIPDILETHSPVCWNCHVAETFRREHSELVTDRPWRRN